MEIDVALVPSEAVRWRDRVCIVIDELRASSTVVTLLDLGCSELFVTRSLDEARRLRRSRGALLAGERRGLTPRGFDHNNSPVELSDAAVSGHPVVLCTSNGTRVLELLREAPVTLIGCLLNATACADAAVGTAVEGGLGIGIVCAGVLGRFALDDAVAAGVLVDRVVAALALRALPAVVSDAAIAARRLWSAYPDALTALEDSASGRLVAQIGAAADVAFCARVDASTTVPILRRRRPMLVERLVAAT